MFSPLTSYGHRIEWLLLFTTRRIVVVVFFGLAASLAHSRPVQSLQRRRTGLVNSRLIPLLHPHLRRSPRLRPRREQPSQCRIRTLYAYLQ